MDSDKAIFFLENNARFWMNESDCIGNIGSLTRKRHGIELTIPSTSL